MCLSNCSDREVYRNLETPETPVKTGDSGPDTLPETPVKTGLSGNWNLDRNQLKSEQCQVQILR